MIDIDATSTSNVVVMELSISQIASQTGVTSRTLRHYESLGLLLPSRVGANGYRFYQQDKLVRLQRILLLRDLGLSLHEIGQALAKPTLPVEALQEHARWLREEQQRIQRQITAVESTVNALKKGRDVMSMDMFDGFDQSKHKKEVTERWGKDAYDAGNRWWSGLDSKGKSSWKNLVEELNRDWIAAFKSGVSPSSEAGQSLARRHADWLASIPGTPTYKNAATGGDSENGADVGADGHSNASGGGDAGSGTRGQTHAGPAGATNSDSDAGFSSLSSSEPAAPLGISGNTQTHFGLPEYLRGLGQMYVSDPRFASNYGGPEGAAFVRDTLEIYALKFD